MEASSSGADNNNNDDAEEPRSSLPGSLSSSASERPTTTTRRTGGSPSSDEEEESNSFPAEAPPQRRGRVPRSRSSAERKRLLRQYYNVEIAATSSDDGDHYSRNSDDDDSDDDSDSDGDIVAQLLRSAHRTAAMPPPATAQPPTTATATYAPAAIGNVLPVRPPNQTSRAVPQREPCSSPAAAAATAAAATATAAAIQPSSSTTAERMLKSDDAKGATAEKQHHQPIIAEETQQSVRKPAAAAISVAGGSSFFSQEERSNQQPPSSSLKMNNAPQQAESLSCERNNNDNHHYHSDPLQLSCSNRSSDSPTAPRRHSFDLDSPRAAAAAAQDHTAFAVDRVRGRYDATTTTSTTTTTTFPKSPLSLLPQTPPAAAMAIEHPIQTPINTASNETANRSPATNNVKGQTALRNDDDDDENDAQEEEEDLHHHLILQSNTHRAEEQEEEPAGEVSFDEDDLDDDEDANNDDDGDDDDENITLLSLADWNSIHSDSGNRSQSANCWGVVHVRVRRARRLPCPVHSRVQVVLRLHPWKGKVRVKEATAVTHACDNAMWGVGVDFGKHSEGAPVTALLHNYAGEDEIDNDNNDSAHAQWPELQIDLVFQPLQLLEFTMCSLRVPCRPLLEQPRTPFRAWLQCGDPATSSSDDGRSPVIQMEAMFEPVASEHSDDDDDDGDDDEDGELDNDHVILKEEDALEVHVPGSGDTNVPEAIERIDADNTTETKEQLEESRKPTSYSVEASKLGRNGAGEDTDGHGEGDEFDEIALLELPAPRKAPSDVWVGDATSSLPTLATQQQQQTKGSTSAASSKASLQSALSSSAKSRPAADDGDTVSALSLQSSLRRTSAALHRKSQQHLLRLTTFRKPAYCCVCGQSITTVVWRTIALHCEACGVDCCDDCRLQVDLQLPCGSEEAQRAVEAAFQNRLTMDNLMHAMAPFDYEHDKSPAAMDDWSRRSLPKADNNHSLLLLDASNRSVSSKKTTQQQSPSPGAAAGVGTVRLEFLRAHVLDEAVPAETDPATLPDRRVRPGEYYVRVAWTGDAHKTVRTRTIQSNGRPKLESGVMKFVVPHYGTEFRIELIDATTDKPVGTSLITAQGLLQQQRDYLVEEKRVPFLSFVRPIRFEGTRRLLVELRAGLKSGFISSEYFTAGKGGASSGGDVRPGDISGCIEMNAGFEEDLQGLFGARPYECPARPGDELNMGMFQLHLQRIAALIQDVKDAIAFYHYVVSWKDPLVTGCSLLIFVRMCMRFDLEYIGSLPVFILLLVMLYLAGKRSFGNIRSKYIQREIEHNRKAENGTVNYDLHRPIGRLRLSIVKGRNIRSPELGLPGNVGCTIRWDPTRLFKNEKQKKRTVEIDGSACAMHEVGSTNYVYAMNPTWDEMIESDETKRLKLLMPTGQGHFFDQSTESDEDGFIDFPILQPLGKSGDLHCLNPWDSSGAAVVVEVHFTDLLNILPGSEYSVGDVSIPFSDIVKGGKISGWYDIKVSDEAETAISFPKPAFLDADESENSASDDTLQVYVKATWVPPEEKSNVAVETVREASHAIQEELVRSARLIQHQSEKLGILGSSLGALNTVRGISSNLQVVQNTLGSTLDIVESCIHAFDFTDPFKSMVLLVAVCIIWLLLSVVSTRLIVFILGLAQYALTLKAKVDRWLSTKTSTVSTKAVEKFSEEEAGEESPIATWITNALRGLPTSEDLRRTYFWESRRLGAKETESIAAAKRKARMEKLWRVQWYRSVRMLTENTNKELEWRTVFAMVQGHRVLWWRSVGDFDSGVPPLGRLFLAGHTGLASPSPLELRKISREEVERVVCIFGSGERTTVLTESVEAKQELENAVEAVLSSKQD